MRFVPPFISLLINIGFLFLLVLMGKGGEVKVYKAYKINLIKIPKEKKEIQKPKLNLVKPKENNQAPKEEPESFSLPIEEKPIDEKEEEIPIIRESKIEEAHIILPVASYEKEEIVDANSLDYPLKIISFKSPKYPKDALENGINGIVKIRLLINQQGFVKDVEIIEEDPKGFGFGEEVLKVIDAYRFNQPKIRGKPTSVYYILPLKFSLQD